MNHRTDLVPYCQLVLMHFSEMDTFHATMTYHAGNTKSFHLTVYGPDESNCAFFFYENYSSEKIESKLHAALIAIKTGNFSAIQKAAKEQDL